MTEKEEDIEKFISREIKKSGFPLEAYACMILDKNDWEVCPHVLYYNDSQKCYNEIDIIASKPAHRRGFRGGKYLGREVLMIECKKQEKKPWIFFEGDVPTRDASSIYVVPPNPSLMSKKNFKKHYYYNQKPCDYHFPCFVTSGKPDVILDAVNHVIDSINFCKNIVLNMLKKINYTVYEIYYPVIILDGRLYSAKINMNGSVKVSETSYLQLGVSRLREDAEITELSEDCIEFHDSEDYIIDIVRKDFFEDFLKNFAQKRS